ncbi:MAG TPA: alpha-hydroxy acid oxidase [Chthoniobacterales bacterium]|nr:alpha-hydroxy acid oxidase [Chthoniobacterales bacterium]
MDHPSERGSSLAIADFLTLTDFESAARQVMAHSVYEFVAGGAGDEISLRANQAAFDKISLLPRVLRPVTHVDPGITLFAKTMPAPILLAPVAYQGLMHPAGELATVRGAGITGTPFVVSANTTVSIEDLAAEAKVPLWFQLYLQKDRGFNRELIQRVEAAGCEALCVTVDTPVLGVRTRQLRAKFEVPATTKLPHRRGLRPGPKSAYDPTAFSNVTWPDIDWLRSITNIRLVLKGILHPEDAELALQHQVDGIIVSNHGARNLDTVIPTIEALPRIVERIEGKIPVLVDGGIRRGTDVLKSLVRGANAVLIGRSYAYALSIGGAEGVAHCLRLLRAELEYAMSLVGCASIPQLDRTIEWSP